MSRWDIAGIVALVLAGGTSVGFVGTVFLLAWAPEPASVAAIQLLGTIGGAVVGSLATYLGARAVGDRDERWWNRRVDLDATQQWTIPPPVPERPERPH